ncbi:MAG: amino acid adenylation domain-containing protein [Algicola sp.]|nr:amino acid adenylation domain-containing protein [Algicola sp.]
MTTCHTTAQPIKNTITLTSNPLINQLFSSPDPISKRPQQFVLTMNLPYSRIYGGANVSNRCLAQGMVALGHNVVVIAPALSFEADTSLQALKSQLTSQGINVQSRHDRFIYSIEGVQVHAVFEPAALHQVLYSELSQRMPDWVFVSAEDPSQTLLSTALSCLPNQVIYLAHTPQMLPFGEESLYPGKRRSQLIGQCRAIVTISNFVAGLVADHFGPDHFAERLLTNHPPHYGDTFPVLARFTNPYVLCINPCAVKGLSIVLGLAKQNPTIAFAVVPGWGTTKTDLATIKSFVNITVLTPQKDLNDLLRQAKLLLVPSLWSEGFGMVTIDAMVRGIPVIASDYGGLKEAKLGTDYLIPINPIEGYKQTLDENHLLQAIVPEQDLNPWQQALQILYFDENEYQQQSSLSRQLALAFVDGLSVKPLSDFLKKLSQQQSGLANADQNRPVSLPIDLLKMTTQTGKCQHASVGGVLKYSVGNKMERSITTINSPVFVIMLSAIKVLLARYSGDVTIAVNVLLETGPETTKNRATISSKVTLTHNFCDLLAQVKHACANVTEQTTEAMADNQANNPNDPNIMVALDGDPTIAQYNRYDIAFLINAQGAGLTLNIVYNTALFTSSTIKRLRAHFDGLLNAMLKAPEHPLNGFELLTPHELKQALLHSQKQQTNNVDLASIGQRFEQMVTTFGGNTAIIDAESQHRLSYCQLNEKANKLAHILRNEGVTNNTIVPIIAEQSSDFIVCLLAVLKAGGCYLPININDPVARITTILDDSQATLVLISPAQQYSLNIKTQQTFNTLWLDDPIVTQAPTNNLPSINAVTDLAYIIYTSGSTGIPKGVMVQHQNVTRLFFTAANPFDFGAGDVWSLFHSLCFDFSVWEMFGALLHGGRLVLISPQQRQDLTRFADLLKTYQVTVLNMVPSIFYHLSTIESLVNSSELSLRYIIFGGDVLQPDKLAVFHRHHPSVKLVNMYGITETAIHSTCKIITNQDITNKVSNIGQALPGVSLHVLDDNLKRLPINVSGQLYVGGVGVSSGYLNKDSLTSACFIDNPYAPGERLYRSGDIVRQLEGGDHQYLGRIDTQVKIRGFRIELAEIEHQLLALPQFKEARVFARTQQTGEHQLIAYVKPRDSQVVLDIDHWQKQLSFRLAQHMVPSNFVLIAHWPLSNNGKIDEKQLPKPAKNNSIDPDISPQTDTEIALAELWSVLLKVDAAELSNNANFFRVGGHSLTATKLMTQCNGLFGVGLQVRDIFELVTLKAIAERIDHQVTNGINRDDQQVNRLHQNDQNQQDIEIFEL